MDRDALTVLIAVFTLFAGMLLMGVMDSRFEKDRCKTLEREIGVNLAYTFSTGCVPADKL